MKQQEKVIANGESSDLRVVRDCHRTPWCSLQASISCSVNSLSRDFLADDYQCAEAKTEDKQLKQAIKDLSKAEKQEAAAAKDEHHAHTVSAFLLN